MRTPTTTAATAASDGRRGDIDRWSRYHDDLEERLAAVREAAVGRPVILYAHSMGGLIGAGYLLSDRPRPDLTVLSAPGLDSTLAAWKKTLAPMVGRIVPTLSVPNGVPPETLSRDPEVGRRLAADPLNCQHQHRSVRRRGARRTGAGACRRPARSAGRPWSSTVSTTGSCRPRATEVFEGAPGVERRTYPGLRHELHNEPEGPQVLDDVVAWVRQRARLRGQPNTASGERLER